MKAERNNHIKAFLYPFRRTMSLPVLLFYSSFTGLQSGNTNWRISHNGGAVRASLKQFFSFTSEFSLKETRRVP